ncbi:hypothetical protein BIY24_00915 [Halobacteriovorax marinus]|uniref:Exported protein n=1 Tax=Halobacteriovorax marinus (strain ATCC BAA-682 / DSM 15412 / SJ) TaxID=862908 RepID=E1X2S3_HALMS|nr:hypothetical protein [Halobacteriovorax marinus]ATH06552.1 hypothetical protein BIY24_00915 [Halobacteriovorax marinus]CBW25118.1 putative exported protein [Halobacteriovorax marinus SJ]
MKKLLSMTALLSLLTLSFSSYAGVGEGSTECIRNQSTQARVAGKSKAAKEETVKESSEQEKSSSVQK